MLWSLPLVPLAAGLGMLTLARRSRRTLAAVASTVLALTLVTAIVSAGAGWDAALEWNRQIALTVVLTPVSATMAILVPVIALPILAYAATHEETRGLARLLGLMLVFVGGMELLVVANDLLTLLIGWEIVGACSWALIAHHWRDGDNPRSGLYAFLMTRFGDLGMFVAAMAVFAGAGSFSYDALAVLPSPYLEIAAIGLVVSAAAKSGQVPFSPWLFRAMAGPTSVSALLHAATMVAAGTFLLIRLAPYLDRAAGFSDAVLLVGLVTALTGGFVAVVQNHAKKLLAASTSAHYGLMFVAVGAGYPGVALLHLVTHAAFKALLFLSAGVAGERAGSFALNSMGCGRAMPFVAAASAVGTLALAGVPPLGGGWTKEAVVGAAGHASGWAALGVMAAGALSAAYAMRFQLLAFKLSGAPPEGETPTRGEYVGVGALALLSLLLALLWVPALHNAVAALLGAHLPETKLPELVLSLLLLALGLIAGRLLAKRYPALGAESPIADFADWLGLPALIRFGVDRPFVQIAVAAAQVDDQVIDALPRAVARVAARVSAIFRRQDQRLVDKGIELTAGFTRWFAHMADRFGESIFDGLPEGSAQLIGLSGRDAPRLQTGLSHHYYALMAAGTAIVVVILLLGL